MLQELGSKREELFVSIMKMNRWPDQKPLRVARANNQGIPCEWHTVDRYMIHSLRAVLPNEVIFDIGDNVSFPEALRQSMILWDLLREIGVKPFYGALSGGGGCHTHVFLECHEYEEWVNPRDPSDVWIVPATRKWFVRSVMGLFKERLGHEPDVDPGHLDPNPESKIVREFGAWKTKQKTLVATHQTSFLQKITNRDQAYATAGMRMPTEVDVVTGPPGVRHYEARRALGGLCPQDTPCFTADGPGGFCATCPIWR